MPTVRVPKFDPADKNGNRLRAYSFRNRRPNMRPLDDEQRAWLAAYEAHEASPPPPAESQPRATPPQDSGGGGTPSGESSPAPQPEGASSGDPPVVGPAADSSSQAPPRAESANLSSAKPAAPAPPPRVAPRARAKLPAPPKVDVRDADARAPKSSAASADWRDKYRTGTNGRERACLEIAGVWLAILKGMEAQITAAGARAYWEVDKLGPAIVLAVDQLLPPKVTITPEIEAAAGSTAIVVQRFMLRKKIAEAEKRETDRKAHEGKLADMKRRTAETEQAYRDGEAARAKQDTPPVVSSLAMSSPVVEPAPVVAITPHMQPAPPEFRPGIDVV